MWCADELVSYGESEENVRVDVRRFVEVCKLRGLKVNIIKTMVLLSGMVEDSKCEGSMKRRQLERVSKYKYLRFMLDESAQMEWNVAEKR